MYVREGRRKGNLMLGAGEQRERQRESERAESRV